MRWRWAVNVAAALFLAECVLAVVVVVLYGWTTIPLRVFDRKVKAMPDAEPNSPIDIQWPGYTQSPRDGS